MNDNNVTMPSPLNGENIDFFVGYEFDGKRYKNISSIPVYEDPIYYQFSEEDRVKYFSPEENIVLLEGERLNFGVIKTDVKVTIGMEFCEVLFLATNFLSCRPPVTQPLPGPEGSGPGGTPMVIVSHFILNVITFIVYINSIHNKHSKDDLVVYFRYMLD